MQRRLLIHAFNHIFKCITIKYMTIKNALIFEQETSLCTVYFIFEQMRKKKISDREYIFKWDTYISSEPNNYFRTFLTSLQYQDINSNAIEKNMCKFSNWISKSNLFPRYPLHCSPCICLCLVLKLWSVSLFPSLNIKVILSLKKLS